MNFVLYNAAHASTKIVSCDGDAWIRILGFFKTKDSALLHAKKLNDREPQEIRIAPVGQFRLMMRFIDRDRESSKHEFLMKTHADNRVKAFADTRKNAEEHKMGDLKFSPRERVEAQVATVHKIVTGGLDRVPHDLELRMQKFAAIAYVPDYEHESYMESKVQDWEKYNLLEEAKQRNLLIREHLNGRILPTFKQSMESWVANNLPPTGHNVFGQLSDTLWEKVPDSSVNNEAQIWLKKAQCEYESKLWQFLDIPRPLYNTSPPPDTTGDEPAVAFLHAGNTEDELVEWIKNSTLTTYDIACVAMYEWIKINDSAYIEKKYREPGLEQLHANKRSQAAEAAKLHNAKVIEIET